jgi:hypothetical protein
MPIDERDRHRLYDRLEEVLGPEEATILMAHLPPVGWADVATKHDLDALREANRLEHEVLKQTIEASKHEVVATLRAEMNHQTRTMFFGMVTTLAAFGGLALAAVRLFT